MGQIHMGRESLFTALVTCFTADQLPLLREAIDARRCHDEVGVGTLTGAAAAYWPDPKCRGAALAASGVTAPLPPASRDGRCRFLLNHHNGNRHLCGGFVAMAQPRSQNVSICNTWPTFNGLVVTDLD